MYIHQFSADKLQYIYRICKWRHLLYSECKYICIRLHACFLITMNTPNNLCMIWCFTRNTKNIYLLTIQNPKDHFDQRQIYNNKITRPNEIGTVNNFFFNLSHYPQNFRSIVFKLTIGVRSIEGIKRNQNILKKQIALLMFLIWHSTVELVDCKSGVTVYQAAE